MFDNCISDASILDPLRRRQRARHGLLPSWISRWAGHRPASSTSTAAAPISVYELYFWSFVGTFCGVALLQAVFGHTRYFVSKGVSPLVPSYAASAALIYGAIEGPLSQPRSFVGGYFIGAFTGVAITKLFLLLPSEQMFMDSLWLSGSLISAFTVIFMQITGMFHPPAGAAAILALMDAETRKMGWYYIPIILLSSLLALAVALIVNNIRRRYPLFWFFPDPDPLTMPSPVYSVCTTASTRVNSVEALHKILEKEKPVIEKPAPVHIMPCPV